MYGMTDEELELLCSLFARQKEIEQVILYGSRAKGTHKPFSDVDITLLGIGLSRSQNGNVKEIRQRGFIHISH